jgi:acyl dehydratase
MTTAMRPAITVRPDAFETWVGPVRHVVDDRWLLGYAAAVGDTTPELFDLTRPDGVVAHPMFVACVEWPLIANGSPGLDIPLDALRKGLHVTHATDIIRPIRLEDALTTTVRLAVAEMRSVGAYVESEFRTVDETGDLHATTRLGMLYPGVDLVGGNQPTPRPAAKEANALQEVARFAVTLANAPIYTECARIWNPIHTDPRVAERYGLPGPVLHGTEILARAVSLLKNDVVEAPAADVTRVEGRFGDIVLPGMTLTVLAGAVERGEAGWRVSFEVLTPGGRPAIRAGALTGS